MEKIILIVSFVVVIGLGFLGFKYLSNIDKRIKNLESKAKETPPVNNLPTARPVPQQNLNEIMKKNKTPENKDSPIVNEYQQYLNTQ